MLSPVLPCWPPAPPYKDVASVRVSSCRGQQWPLRGEIKRAVEDQRTALDGRWQSDRSKAKGHRGQAARLCRDRVWDTIPGADRRVGNKAQRDEGHYLQLAGMEC